MCSFGLKENSLWFPTDRTNTLSSSLFPTGTLGWHMLGMELNKRLTFSWTSAAWFSKSLVFCANCCISESNWEASSPDFFNFAISCPTLFCSALRVSNSWMACLRLLLSSKIRSTNSTSAPRFFKHCLYAEANSSFSKDFISIILGSWCERDVHLQKQGHQKANQIKDKQATPVPWFHNS